MALEPIEGELFRRNYLREPVPLADSQRARRRLYRAFMRWETDNSRFRFARDVEAELGTRYPVGYNGYLHETFWTQDDIADVLSAITLWCTHCERRADFLREARRIFQEEDLRYRIDDRGGVHFLVDEEFERVVETALAGLGQQRFASAREALEVALESLGPQRQSGKALIRNVFEAVESAFLVVIGQPAVNQLNERSIDAHLKPILLARYAEFPEPEDKVERAIEAFKKWVHSAHPFRHGAPLDEIHEAPLDLAVMSATQGMGFVRWLVDEQH